MSTSNLSRNFFSNKLKKDKSSRDFRIISFLGAFLFSGIYLYNYKIGFREKSSNLPEVNILCEEELNTNEMVDCKIKLECKDQKYNIESIKAKIKIRGGGAGDSSYPKKGYRIKLSMDKTLLGMRKEDDWNLYALYLDFPRIRIKYANNLWESLRNTNPTAFSIDSRFVSVYLNGEYKGLYLLAERYNRKFFGLKDSQNDINSSLIFQAKGGCSLIDGNCGRWQQDWPNEYEGYYIMNQVLHEICEFIMCSSNEVFFDPEQGIFSKFNKQNLIDFFIFNFFIDHKDFWNKNYYIVRDTYPNKFFLIPCDYDGCLGQYGWNYYRAEYNPESFIRMHNALFNRLLDNEDFVSNCKNRWFKLRETHWTEEYLFDEMYDIYHEIKDDIEVDHLKWFGTVKDYSKEDFRKDLEDLIKHLTEYFPKRLIFCDRYFGYQ